MLESPELADDPRFTSNVLRMKERALLDGEVQARLGRRRFVDVAAALDRHAIAYGTVSTVGGLIDHPAATALPVPTPNGPVEVLAPSVVVDGQRVAMRPVPALGQHDAALRAEFARQTEERPS